MIWKGDFCVNKNADKVSKKKNIYGRGTVYYDNTHNCFCGQISIDLGHKKTRKTVYAKSEKEVIKKLDKLRIESAAGLYIEKNNTTLLQLANQFLDEQLSLNLIKASTYSRKRETLKTLEPIYNLQIQSITEGEIKKFFANYMMNYSQSTINKSVQLLKAVFSEAKRRKIIKDNFLEDFKYPKSKNPQEEVRGFTLEEEQRFIEALRNSNVLYKEIMLISLFTGMRTAEISALNVEDINLEKRLIYVNKTVSKGKNNEATISNETKTKAGMRKLYINQEIADFLACCIGERTEGLLFTSSNNNIVRTQNVYYQFRKIIDNYDIIDKSIPGKVDLHSLRHTYCSRCYESNMPVKTLQYVLGHTDISTTMNVYLDVFDDTKSKCIEDNYEYLKAQNISIL